MKKIALLAILTIIIMSAGCLTTDEATVDNYEELNQNYNITSGENFNNSIKNVSVTDETIELTIESYAPASNYRMNITNVEIVDNNLRIEGKLEESAPIGNTVITKVNSPVRINGDNLEQIDSVSVSIENSVVEENIRTTFE